MLTLRKKIAYSALTTVLFFSLTSALIFVVESLGWIDTERLNDRVAYAPVHSIVVNNTSNGRVVRIEDPMMIRQEWKVQAPPRTLRILLAGGSFAQSNPYSGNNQPESFASPGSIHGWLEQLLRHRFPDLNVEVINIAAGSANSSRVVGLVKAAMVLRPQIVIVAMGNNEGYVPASANQAMHRWVLYRVLKKELLADRPTTPQPYWMVQTREFSAYKDTFGRNLVDLVRIVTEHGAQLVLSVMPINIDYDFSGRLAPPPPDANFDEGQRLLNANQYEAAIQRLAAAPASAYQAKLIATAYERLGLYDLAREALLLAMSFVPVCRTAPDLNALITEFAQSRGLPLANLDAAVQQASENGLHTSYFFCDSCHMHWKGYYLVALEMARTIEGSGLIPAGHTPAQEFPSSDVIRLQPGWSKLGDDSICLSH